MRALGPRRHQAGADHRLSPVTGVGIIGASTSGGWALRAHLPALALLPEFTVAAVATTRAETARATCEQFGVASGYTSSTALAADPRVELVSVTVKIPDHAAAVEAAVVAGKDVYCEWPLAGDTGTAARLRDLTRLAGVRATIGLQARANPVLRQLRDLLADGYLGRVLSVGLSSTGYANGGPVLRPDREWSADDANGLSALTVRAAHTLDAVGYCVSPIANISADIRVATPVATIEGTSRSVARTAPDQVLMTGRLANGASVSGRFLLGVYSDYAPLMTVHGTEGTALVRGTGPEPQIQISALELYAARHGGDFEPLATPARYSRTPSAIQDAAARGVAENYLGIDPPDGRWISPDFGDAVRLHELLDALRASSREKRTVEFTPAVT
jgi:predicted dehydrogenase